MLTGNCINPKLIASLALLGHGDQILIADGNYPLASQTNDNCDLIYLGLYPGMPTTTEVLNTILSVINVESALVMDPQEGVEPSIFNEFRGLLNEVNLEKIGRYEFYESAKKSMVKLAISTGEKRVFGNILVTVGVA